MDPVIGFGLFAVFIGLLLFASGKIKKLKAKGPGGFGLQLEANDSTPPVKPADPPPRSASPGTALHQLPRPAADFTGRKDELAELADMVKKGGAIISGLHGMGGVGKTALALKLAEQLKPHYPDAQIYLDLKGTDRDGEKPLSAADAMAHVIHAFDLKTEIPEAQGELSGLYHSKLDGKRALLLMDNALDGEQVKPLLPLASCLFLVTSRQYISLDGLQSKNLDVVSAEDAKQLLLAICPPIGEHAAEMAKLCGYLPMALRNAANALVKSNVLGPEEYIKRLGDAKKRLDLASASLSLSYDLLDEAAQKHWRTLAVFPETFDHEAAAALWEMPADEAADVLDNLIGYSLVLWNKDSKRARLHDLARDYADSKMDNTERLTAQYRHAAHYQSVLWNANDLYIKGGAAVLQGLALFDREWANIQTGQTWAVQHAGSDMAAAKLCNFYPAAGANVLDLRRHPREIIRWLEITLDAASRLNDRQMEGNHLGNLGGAYQNLGETRRAIEFYEKALSIDREIGDRKGEAADLGNLGNAYAVLGETRHAIKFYKKALIIDREIGNRRGESADLGNLGLAYADLGKTHDAIKYYKKQLAIVREIGDRRGEGNALFNMSQALNTLGKRGEAVPLARQALEIFEAIEDPNAEIVRAQLREWEA